jgi:hypothetical protein
LLTRIIEAIAIPRKTSRDFKRMEEKFDNGWGNGFNGCNRYQEIWQRII